MLTETQIGLLFGAITLLISMAVAVIKIAFSQGRQHTVQETHTKDIAEIKTRIDHEVAERNRRFELFEERQGEAMEKIAEVLGDMRAQLSEHNTLLKHIVNKK